MLWSAKNSNGQAVNMLIPIVYHELRCLAAHVRGERPADSPQPTGLVHEEYMGLSQHSR